MTRRVVAVLAVAPHGAAPPGVDDVAFAAAMLEDVVDLVTAMQQVDVALAAPLGCLDVARRVVWPGTPVLTVPDDPTVVDVLDAVAAEEGVVVCADAPDLPPLLLGKLHSSLTTAEVAVCPAEGGGLVALAARLPAPAWLRTPPTRLDADDALRALRARAPAHALHVAAGWHRVRASTDVARLDLGLEGWDATRALLGG